jgi:chromosome segregation ATPase
MSVIEDSRKVMQDFLAPELRAIAARLDAVEKRFDLIDKKVDEVDRRAEKRHEALMGRHDVLVDRHNAVANQLTTQFASVTTKLDVLLARQDSSAVGSLAKRFEAFDERVEARHQETLAQMRELSEISDLKVRMARIEERLFGSRLANSEQSSAA